MATQAASPATALPSAQVVGNAFVDQYYHILHESPGLVHKFYQDSSVLSRPNSNGQMISVTTMQAINDMILSLDYANYKAEIRTADAQDSYKEGVIVLVTGCLTGKDNVRKKFSQTFFLAPQEKGYFVLNDVFRYAEDTKFTEVIPVSVNSVDDNTPMAPLPVDPEPVPVTDHPVSEPTATFETRDVNDVAEVCDPSDHEEVSVTEEEVTDEAPVHSSQNEINTVPISDSSAVHEEKKSYASIVKVAKVAKAASTVYAPTSSTRAKPPNADKKPPSAAKPSPEPEVSAPSAESAPENNTPHDEAEGHSIYVKNLPLQASVSQLEEEFKKFGPIKQGGIQVRSNKIQGFCFGFVEFATLEAMQAAIQEWKPVKLITSSPYMSLVVVAPKANLTHGALINALQDMFGHASPVTIGDHQSVVEEKRTTTRVGSNGRGRYLSGRGGYRNDSFRGRGNFSGGRGYGRNDFRSHGEFSGRPRGPTGRGGESYQRVDQNGSGGLSRPSGPNKFFSG